MFVTFFYFKSSDDDEDSSQPDAKKARTAANSESAAKPKERYLDKPRQLFWEKRLSGLRASYPDEGEEDEEEEGEEKDAKGQQRSHHRGRREPFKLPSLLKPVGPPGIDEEGSGEVMVLASISTSLHLGGGSGAAGAASGAAASGATGQKNGAADLPTTEIKGQANVKVSLRTF